VLHECLAGGTVAGDDIHDAGRKPHLLADFGKGERGKWSKLRGF
jgi:hypothetical protein